MKSAATTFAASAAFLALAAAVPALAQPIPPEARIERLERQLQQLQRRVFPQGQPANTAGLAYEPAATQAAVSNLDNRLVALERQLADVLRISEENAHRLRQLDSQMQEMSADQDRRLRAMEDRLAAGAAPTIAPTDPDEAPMVAVSRPVPKPATSNPAASSEDDPAELAYDDGYELWKAGKFDAAVTSLRAMAKKYPGHRRVSWANNLAGRSLLDKGEPRAAAEALLANYRANPQGERAADSLYYLGRALMQLKQSEQACKAYAELEAVYGEGMRGELKRLLPGAKAEAGCS